MYGQQFIPDKTKDLEEWFEALAEEFFQNIGINSGQKVLDVGCGVGTYAITAAKAVGESGLVYAIDKNKICIKELKKRSKNNGVSSIIQPILTDGSFNFPIEDESIDHTLLCDFIGVVLHVSKNLTLIEELMKEVQRVTKQSGKVTIIFKHVSNWRFPKDKVEAIISKYFTLENEFIIPHIHWDFKETDSVYSYVKI